MYTNLVLILWIMYAVIFITLGIWSVYGFVWGIIYIIIAEMFNLDYDLFKIKYPSIGNKTK